MCWNSVPDNRPTFDEVKKTIHKINPSKLSPVDLMMAMVSDLNLSVIHSSNQHINK